MNAKQSTERKSKKNRTKRIIVIGVVLLFVFLIVARRTGIIGGDEQVKVATEQVQLRDITEFVTASGKIQPKVEVRISPDVSGEVVEIFVKEGDEVKQGDRLARIKPDTYQANYEQIKASFDGQKANLANAKARLSQTRAQLFNAEAVFNRSKTLYDQGLVSKADYESVKVSYEVAMAEVEAAEQTVKAAEFGVKSAEATMNEARNSLMKTTIFAPMDGTVYQLTVETGERVAGASQFSAGTEIMRIADLNEMEVQVSINENDIIRIDHGDSVNIMVDAYLQKTFRGIVTRISNASASGSQMISSTDQVTNYDVRIRILPESYSDLIDESKVYKYPFRPGMSASVDIITGQTMNVISVPIQSVTTREDTSKSENKSLSDKAELIEVVFVYLNGNVEMRRVTTGGQDSYYIQVLTGLESDEEVVVSPYSAVSRKLKDKDPVKKVDKSQLFEN